MFISVEDGIEGLVHISELANRHVENPETVVKPGEIVFVKVIDVDLDRRRISLSLKQANDSVDPASEGLRSGAVRHAGRVRRAGQLQVP